MSSRRLANLLSNRGYNTTTLHETTNDLGTWNRLNSLRRGLNGVVKLSLGQ